MEPKNVGKSRVPACGAGGIRIRKMLYLVWFCMILCVHRVLILKAYHAISCYKMPLPKITWQDEKSAGKGKIKGTILRKNRRPESTFSYNVLQNYYVSWALWILSMFSVVPPPLSSGARKQPLSTSRTNASTTSLASWVPETSLIMDTAFLKFIRFR